MCNLTELNIKKMNLKGFGARKKKVQAAGKFGSLTTMPDKKKNLLQDYLNKKDSYGEKVKEAVAPKLKEALKEISKEIIKNGAAYKYQKHLTRSELIQKLESRIKKMREFKEKVEKRKQELIEEGFEENDVYDEFDEDEVLGDDDEIDPQLKDFLLKGKKNLIFF